MPITKIYRALLTQVNQDMPTAIILNKTDSNYLGDITWSRDDWGLYSGSIAGVFDLSKISVNIAQNAGGRVLALSAYQANSVGMGDLIPVIETRSWDTTPSPDFYPNDNLLYYTLIEITAQI